MLQRYLTFCGIGIQNAQLFDTSVAEYRRNQVCEKSIPITFATLCGRNSLRGCKGQFSHSYTKIQIMSLNFSRICAGNWWEMKWLIHLCVSTLDFLDELNLFLETFHIFLAFSYAFGKFWFVSMNIFQNYYWYLEKCTTRLGLTTLVIYLCWYN